MVRTNERHFWNPETVQLNDVCFEMLNYVIDGVGLWKKQKNLFDKNNSLLGQSMNDSK